MKLAVLIIEDSFFSADLNVREIRKAGFEVEYLMVSSKKSMIKVLKDSRWDVIICDNSMPNFNALMALEVRNNINKDIPFVIVAEYFEDKTSTVKEVFLPKESLQELGNIVKSLVGYENEYTKK